MNGIIEEKKSDEPQPFSKEDNEFHNQETVEIDGEACGKESDQRVQADR
jgi:hypothetical protein